MRNKIAGFLVLVVIMGCKDKHQDTVFITDDIDNLFNLRKYQVTLQKKISDSIIQYKGKNDRFLIEGKYNILKKRKIGWWKTYDKMNGEKYIDVEFFNESDNPKELNNQILFYRGNKIDTLNSKFYSKEYDTKNNTILYNFYCSQGLNKLHSAKVNIGIISNGKPLFYPTDFECEKIADGHYQYSLNVSEYSNLNLNIIGLFSEYSTNENKNKLGVDQIFINDTIQIKQELPVQQ